MSSAKERGELTITLRMKGRPVVLVGEGDVAEEHRSLLKRAGAFIVAEGSKAVFAVVVDDPAAVSRLKVRGCLVYAVGQPELSDFTLAGPASPGKSVRKADSPPAMSRLPNPVAEPIAEPAPAIVERTPEIAEPRQAVKPPEAPRPEQPQPEQPRAEQPRAEFKMPQVSFGPALRAATKTAMSPLLRISLPFTQVVAANIQDRIDRARERPISLDLALVKGGLLDHEPEAPKADGVEAHASEDPHLVSPPRDAADPAPS